MAEEKNTDVRLNGQGLTFALRLAGACASREGLPPSGEGHLAAGEVAALAAHPAFARPVASYLVAARAWPDLSAARLAELSDRPEGRLAMLAASEPRRTVDAAGRLIAAAVLHKRILRVALKADRERLRAVFGADGFGFATQEAPALHSGLAVLDTDPAVWNGLLDGNEDAGSGRLSTFGLDLVGRFVAGVDAALGALMRSRFGLAAAGGLGETERALVLRLLRRRVPSWPAIIG